MDYCMWNMSIGVESQELITGPLNTQHFHSMDSASFGHAAYKCIP